MARGSGGHEPPRLTRRALFLGAGGLLLGACSSGKGPAKTPAATATASNTGTPVQPTSPAASPTATATPSPVATPTATATSAPLPPGLPLGFPLDPETKLGLVRGEVGAREIAWGAGPAALVYSRDDQPSDDPVLANGSGWDARTHLEYEGQPAVDWYIPEGTPIYATMAGTATLLVNTTSNPFDVYGVSREPYIGNPDRARAPVSPFPGPGGGQGAFVRIDNGAYRTDSAHFDLEKTMAIVPGGAWLAGFGPGPELLARFVPVRDFRVATAVAQWPVRRGDLIGYSGDSGYSEAPHLHYAIRPSGSDNALCPTTEAGFADGGWLFRTG